MFDGKVIASQAFDSECHKTPGKDPPSKAYQSARISTLSLHRALCRFLTLRFIEGQRPSMAFYCVAL